jgi:hypothetical protein
MPPSNLFPVVVTHPSFDVSGIQKRAVKALRKENDTMNTVEQVSLSPLKKKKTNKKRKEKRK